MADEDTPDTGPGTADAAVAEPGTDEPADLARESDPFTAEEEAKARRLVAAARALAARAHSGANTTVVGELIVHYPGPRRRPRDGRRHGPAGHDDVLPAGERRPPGPPDSRLGRQQPLVLRRRGPAAGHELAPRRARPQPRHRRPGPDHGVTPGRALGARGPPGGPTPMRRYAPIQPGALAGCLAEPTGGPVIAGVEGPVSPPSQGGSTSEEGRARPADWRDRARR